MAQDPTKPNSSIIEQLSRQATSFTNTSLNLPQHLEGALTRLEQGDLKMRVNSVEANRELRQLNSLVLTLVYAILFSTLLLTATQFLLAGWFRTAAVLLGLTSLSAIILCRKLFFKPDKLIS